MSEKKEAGNGGKVMVRFFKTGGTVFAAFIAGCLGGLCVILVHDRLGIHLRHTDPANWAVSSAEVMSTANTFIVYTTFIFVIVTLLTTGLGILLAKWFATTRENEIRDAANSFYAEIAKDKEFAKNFVANLMKNEEVTREFKCILQAQILCEFNAKKKDDNSANLIDEVE